MRCTMICNFHISCTIKDFFFFQAEDGIRDIGVTGIQTCALPISMLANGRGKPGDLVVIVAGSPPSTPGSTNLLRVHRLGDPRSEERRGGKECRSRWPTYH